MSADLQRDEELFSAALDIEDAAKREAFLHRAAGGDVGLRERVRRLLEAVDRAGRYFDRVERNTESANPLPEPRERVGDRIGSYKLLEQIGEGGFGAVYVAEQDMPIRRKVALKIIKLGMDTRQVIARFEVERQALALMEHSNIAKVFDAGTTDTGRPYFVMELVRGLPITQFCDQQRFTPEQRLRLFMEVCDAIQHAHQKGIIHRDLKPSNILVTMNGHRAVPKVIDFGIAKATREPLTDKTLHTRFHQFIGTPEYISPEQAEMSEVKVDTRSDIYSLGVLLYELLVGRPPFAAKELLKAGFDQVRRVLRDEQPLRPSRQLRRLDQVALTTTAERRRCAPQQLLAWFRGDLEQVILKAIEKDVDRRYASAAALAEDIQRFLQQEPVAAVPPSRLYLLRKFVRRHRVSVTAAFLVVAALFFGFIRTSRANVRAQREVAVATAALDFIQEDLLGRLDPFIDHAEEDWGRNLSLLEAVQTAAGNLGERFADQPLVEASLRLTIGRTYLRLGEAESAGPHLERSVALFTQNVGQGDARTWEARYYRADYLNRTGRSVEAIAIHEEILDLRRNRFGPHSPAALESMNALAWALFDANPTNYVRAEALFRETITEGSSTLGKPDPLILRAKEGLCEILYQEGRIEEYARLTEEVDEVRHQVLGAEHPEVLYSEALRAYHLRYRYGDLHAAEALGTAVLEKSRRVLGPDHPTTLLMIMEEGMRLGARGLWGSAIESRRQLLQTTRRRYGDEHPRTLWAEDLLGGTLRFAGDYAAAEQVHRASTEVRLRTGQTQTVAERRSQRYLGLAVFHQGRIEEAEQICAEVCRQTGEAHGLNSARYLFNMRLNVALMGKQAKWPEVTRAYRDLAIHDSTTANPFFPMGQLPPAAGMLAAQLADDAQAARELADLAVERHGGTTNLSVARQISLAGLSLPREVPSKPQGKEFHRLADLVVKQSSNPTDVALASGLMAYRIGAFEEASRHLEFLTRNPDHALASTAGFVQAMVLFNQGASQEAYPVLRIANRQLEVGLSPGLLGHHGSRDFGYDLRWADYARSLILRSEAEALVLGGILSPPVNRETLTARRRAWQSRQELLEEAHQGGRRRDWAAASDSFAGAMNQGAINWEEEGNLISGMALKAAAVFALNGNGSQYSALCHDLVGSAAVSQSYYGRIALLWPQVGASGGSVIEPTLLMRAIEMARWDASQIKPSDRPAQWHEWVRLQLGIAEYRAGNFTKALDPLAKARDAFNLAAAGTACAFSALASQATGQSTEAAGFLEQAETHFEKLLAGNPDRLGQDWEEVAILELALREARAAVATGSQ